MLQIDAMTVVIGLITLIAAILGVLGTLILRAVSRVDDGVKSLDAKVDAQDERATKTVIDLTELRARVTVVEFLVHGGRPSTPKPPERPE